MIVPTFVTHYYRASRRPFRNLSDLEADEALAVMAALASERDAGLQHRSFGRTYLRMRRETEQRLRAAFDADGGQRTRVSPHYFVLGESAWFRGLARDMREIRVPLAALPEPSTSVTYPDSFTAMGVSAEYGFGNDPTPCQGRVYRLEDVAALVDRYGLPVSNADPDYRGYEHRSTEHYIEVQLWADEPVAEHLVAIR